MLDSEITFAMFVELITCSEGYIFLLVISDFLLVNLSGVLDVVFTGDLWIDEVPLRVIAFDMTLQSRASVPLLCDTGDYTGVGGLRAR